MPNFTSNNELFIVYYYNIRMVIAMDDFGKTLKDEFMKKAENLEDELCDFQLSEEDIKALDVGKKQIYDIIKQK